VQRKEGIFKVIRMLSFAGIRDNDVRPFFITLSDNPDILRNPSPFLVGMI
jgi:hypothetical protein